MAWELEITTIDVGQGESSLIIAQDVGGLGGSRTMLIDAGRAGRAQFVAPYVRARLAARGIARLDHLVVSHYDVDHSGGVLSLLNNDNLWQLCLLMAGPAVTAWNAAFILGSTPGDCAAAAAAAAAATARGAYDLPGRQYAYLAPLAATYALTTKTNPTVKQGAQAGRDYMEYQTRNDNLLVTPQSCDATAIAAGNRILAGPAPVTPRQVATASNTAIRNAVKNPIATHGLYRDTHVIDIGDSEHRPREYLPELRGRLDLKGGTSVDVPGTARTHREVFPDDNGIEVLWATGGGAGPAPANSPAAYLVANNKWIWRAPDGTCPIAGEPDNADSIGLVIRFNNFFFYTGGDLPFQGEDLVGTSIMTKKLPNPHGAAFALPTRIAAFKVGHHGSDESTSTAFLQTIKPRAGVVSCGKAQFRNENHPTQAVVNRLEARTNTGTPAHDMELFYLTNCIYPRTYIARSTGGDQLAPTSHSRVSGDNNIANAAAMRRRGDTRLFLTQAESTANAFHVEYFENKPNVLAPAVFGVHPPIGARTENHAF
jgi:beta-lactamase superfamily II metal-dependent hydrolase